MSGTVVNFMLRAADSAGVDLPPILAAAGFSLLRRTGRELQISDNASVAQLAATFEMLVGALCEMSPQQGATDRPSKADVDLFCYCLINCETLADVVERAIRFTRISNDRWGELRLHYADDKVAFAANSRRSRNAAVPFLLDVCSLAFFYKLFSWLIAAPLQLDYVQLVHDREVEDGIVGMWFGCRTVFGAHQTALVFDAEILSRPVVRTYQEMSKILERLPIALLPLPRLISVRAQVERVFHKAFDDCHGIPNLEQVASRLGRSASTLRRNLSREHTSFQEIADHLRMQRAVELLVGTALTLDEIAAAVGFSAASVFSRAFKGWTGRAPSTYRRSGNE